MDKKKLRSLFLAALGTAFTLTAPAYSYAQTADSPPAAAEETPTLPDTNVQAAPPQGEAQPFVTGDGFDYDPVIDGTTFAAPIADGYGATQSTTGSIIAMPDADIAATVNVVTRDVMDDQIALQLDDIVRNAGGVTIGGGDGIFVDRLFLRGIQLQPRDFRRDGFLDPTLTPRDFQSIERVEILKGPPSVLYGAASPAGVVNLVTKQPIFGTFSTAGYTFGSYERSRFTVDTNGLANESGSVLYRVNAAQEDAQSFRDFDFVSRTLIAPTVSWQIDPSTKLTYSLEWHRDDRRGDQGFPAINGDPLALPPNRYIGEPANDRVNYEETRQTLRLTHELSDEWTFNVGGYSLFNGYPLSVTQATSNPPPIGPFYFRNRNEFTRAQEQTQSVIANLAGDTEIAGHRNRLVIGTEYVYFNSDTTFSTDTLPPINVFAPTYTNPPPFGFPFGVDNPTFQQQRIGVYAQDVIDLNDYWKATAGVRVDSVDFRFDRDFTFAGFPVGGAVTDQNFTYTTPRAGLIYQPYADDTLAFYYNYAQSFQPPNGGIYLNPNPLRPVLGETHEIGVKTLLTENLTLNAAGFYTTRDNADLNVESVFITQVAQERSQGAEVNLLGKITERWNATANYTYVDVRLSDPSDPQFDGKRQRNVPFNSANFFTRYNFIQNDVHTIGAALGLVYLDSRPGDLQNTFNLPSYGRWDAGLYYNRGPIGATCYLENLFDKEYAQSSINANQVFPGAPFNVRANVFVSW